MKSSIPIHTLKINITLLHRMMSVWTDLARSLFCVFHIKSPMSKHVGENLVFARFFSFFDASDRDVGVKLPPRGKVAP
jgi:hypothetical protein